MNLNDLYGIFRNPYNTSELILVANGEAFAVRYTDYIAGMIKYTNTEALDEVEGELKENEDSWFYFEYSIISFFIDKYKNSIIFPKQYFDEIKNAGRYYKYGEIDDESKKIVRYHIKNLLEGGKTNPVEPAEEQQSPNPRIYIDNPIEPRAEEPAVKLPDNVITGLKITGGVLLITAGFAVYLFFRNKNQKK